MLKAKYLCAYFFHVKFPKMFENFPLSDMYFLQQQFADYRIKKGALYWVENKTSVCVCVGELVEL